MTAAPAASMGAFDAPFWNGLAAGALHIQRCVQCAHWHWPPQWRCGQCGGWEMDWPEVSMAGVIHALSWTHHPFSPQTASVVPYPVLLVELPAAGGARLLGRLRGPTTGLVIGAAVVGTVEQTQILPALRWELGAEHAS